jgi:outer membrane protein assembly factor BamB
MRFDFEAIRLALFVFAGLASFAPVQAAENNWANWRGPNYDGSLADANPPLEWSDTKNIRWKVPVPGRGSGSPIVWDGQIILLTAIDTGKPPADAPAEAAPTEPEGGPGGGGRGNREAPTNEFEFIVLSYSLADGRELWRTTVNRAVPNESGHQTNTFASASAVTDGKRIYANFGSHGIYALEMQGKVIWGKDLGDMRTRNSFGEGASPALVGNTLIVPWDQEENSAIFALNTADGEIRWQRPREEVTTWATPLAVEFDGRTQIVTNGTQVRSYDLDSGELLWSCGGQVTNPIPSPVRIDDFVVCMTGYRGNAIYAMPLDAKGDISDSPSIRWFNRDAAPYVASPTVYKGQLYFTKERSGAVSSIDARTGQVLIPPTRLTEIRDIYASPVAAADRIYFTSRDGVTTVIRHGATLEELAVNKLGEPVDASPALVGDQILLRAAEHLYCVGE